VVFGILLKPVNLSGAINVVGSEKKACAPWLIPLARLGLFVVATGMVAGFFVAIFAAFTPQYLGMFRHLFGR
jgi:hypothetical protein